MVTMMTDDIKQQIDTVRQAIADLKASQSSCATNVEIEYQLMELEDELQELKIQLAAIKQQS